MNRGELWTVAGGVYSSKPRPAVIAQDDAFGGTDSVTVLPLTSVLLDAPLVRIRLEKDELTGLERDSDVMVDKVTTIRRSSAVSRIGRLPSEKVVEIERALMVFLGLAR